MQLNIYVPKEKAAVLTALDRAAKLTGRSKNELVLEAIEKYVPLATPELGLYNMGKINLPCREDIYAERLTR